MLEKDLTKLICEFEHEYFPCAKEWWCVVGFFNTIDDGRKWSFKADFSQIISRLNKIWSYYSFTIFDLNNKKSYFYNLEIESVKLVTAKDNFNIKCGKSFIKGGYPKYQMHFLNLNNNIILDLKFNAVSFPHRVAQQVTNGWLPWGLGYYRYAFIPKNDFKGSINIDNKKCNIEGKGYFEHIWGDFSYIKMSPHKRSIKKTISIYTKLINRWIHSQEIKIPKSITFCTDNRPPGYDWAWIILDNGWSLFYGNMMCWISEGFGTGVLILSKDGKHYNEFNKIQFKYNKMKYLDKYDFYYPIDVEIIATKEDERLFLHIFNITEGIENLSELEDTKDTLAIIVSQVPCKIEGYYIKNKKKVSLKGISKLESHRILKVFGHNLIRINCEFSKKCFETKFYVDTHYFGKNLLMDMKFLPKPNLKVKFNRTNKFQFKK